ncbi:hypothetical protein M5K25_007386 [Dendrobium thyrsiflorum]|uniref:Uncharacterized protein n=1 Tax=Dendrobium thyrsiflorum TaxID=117978 RepID=A0ABD0VF30_DENTH
MQGRLVAVVSKGGPEAKQPGKCLVRKRSATYGVEVGANDILLSLEKNSHQKLIAEEPETDATDGNIGEGRREPPAVADPASSSLNATLETFTQMMATMTQMLKNIQAPASGSGGGPIGGSSGGPVILYI